MCLPNNVSQYVVIFMANFTISAIFLILMDSHRRQIHMYVELCLLPWWSFQLFVSFALCSYSMEISWIAVHSVWKRFSQCSVTNCCIQTISSCQEEIMRVMWWIRFSYWYAVLCSFKNLHWNTYLKMYGFEGEVKKKFTNQMAEFFTEIFCQLPLCHLINRKIFVSLSSLCLARGAYLLHELAIVFCCSLFQMRRHLSVCAYFLSFPAPHTFSRSFFFPSFFSGEWTILSPAPFSFFSSRVYVICVEPIFSTMDPPLSPFTALLQFDVFLLWLFFKETAKKKTL